MSFIDPDGMEADDWRINYVDKAGKSQSFMFDGTQTALPDNQFVKDFVSAYNYNVGNGGGQAMAAIAANDIIVDVQEGGSDEQYGNGGVNVVNWNPSTGLETTNGSILSPATLLEHEADHALKYAAMPNTQKSDMAKSDAKYENKEEKRVIQGKEQTTARANGEIPASAVTRDNHKGMPVITTSPTSNKVDKAKTYNNLKSQASQGNYAPGFGGADIEKYKP